MKLAKQLRDVRRQPHSSKKIYLNFRFCDYRCYEWFFSVYMENQTVYIRCWIQINWTNESKVAYSSKQEPTLQEKYDWEFLDLPDMTTMTASLRFRSCVRECKVRQEYFDRASSARADLMCRSPEPYIIIIRPPVTTETSIS